MTTDPKEGNAMASEAAAERTVASAERTRAAAGRSVAAAEAAQQDVTNSGWAIAKKLSLYKLASNARVITLIWITSAILNVLFLASIVVLAVLANSNATAVHNSSVSQCQQNNTARRQDIAIWNLLLSQPRSKPLTGPQQAAFGELKQLVKVKDTPRNCVRVYAP